ncbi:MAG: hypothetical protein KBG83_08100 [Bacteroidetes bacterium]|nr:hypothetical protein [Bacteroidota bacterium]
MTEHLKTIIKISYNILLLFCANLFFQLPLYAQNLVNTNDTLMVYEAMMAPKIDGFVSDLCWQEITWVPINYVWIPYGAPCDTTSFVGKYKCCWSSKTNRLYFFIEVKDNAFVDGFVPGKEPDIYNFDIAEVFIDEDASGGLHIFDAVGKDTLEWGANAENAFTYHIYAPFPAEGKTSTHPYVADLAGKSWDDVHHVNYASHLPEFILRREGNTAFWEFSLIVYDSTFDIALHKFNEVKLFPGKEIGFSVAYCDNDSADGVRDAMFGSDWEPAPGNLHWMNADYFRKVKLMPHQTVSVHKK